MGRATGPQLYQDGLQSSGYVHKFSSIVVQWSASSSTSSARLAPTTHPLDDIGGRLHRRFYPTYGICGIVLPIVLLISRFTGSPQRDDYDSPIMNPQFDNRSPSPGRPLYYQGEAASYRPQPPTLQMPIASSDRLAGQPTVCVK